jgi:ATP-dependent RNA helicase DOB1
VLASFKNKQGTNAGGEAGKLAAMSNMPEYTSEVLLHCLDRHFDDANEKDKVEDASNVELMWRGSSRHCRPVKNGVDDEKISTMRLFTVNLETVNRVSAVRLFVPQSLNAPEARKKVSLSVNEVNKRFPDGVPLLDHIKDLGIDDSNFKTLIDRAEALTSRIASHKLTTDFAEEDRIRLVQSYDKKSELKEQARALRDEARSCQTMAMKEDLKKMKRVLKKLGHVDSDGVIQTKGRTACETIGRRTYQASEVSHDHTVGG